MKTIKSIVIATLVCATLVACGQGQRGEEKPQEVILGAKAVFDPARGALPFPSDVLFNGSQDGTLNIPVANPNDLSDPKVALNALDGFSTVAPITASFAAPLNPDTVAVGHGVRVFAVTMATATGPVIGVLRELSPLEIYAAVDNTDTGATLAILPLTPLAPKTTYMVALTNEILDMQGRAIIPDLTFTFLIHGEPLIDGSHKSRYRALSDAQANQLEPLRLATQAMLTAAQNYTITQDAPDAIHDLEQDRVKLAWTFTTQSIDDALASTRAQATSGNPHIQATNMTTKNIKDTLPGRANIYAGTLDVPYYLDASDPLLGRWSGAGGAFLTKYHPQPVAKSTQTIPMLLTVPNDATKPASGWPIVIFQHGITKDRTNVIAVADSLAAAGFAAVAIDLPLHGIADATSGLYSGPLERHLNLDLVNNDTRAPGPDRKIDTSGTHFINLASLLTTRDNLRQGVADLFTLTKSIPTMDYDGGDNGPDFDTSRIYFFGHSLGAIVGTTFLALEPDVKSATLAMPGGGLAKLLDGSPTFGPEIAAGLAAHGVNPGTTDYQSFMVAAQTLMDSGDAINYAAAARGTRGLYVIEVVGTENDTNHRPDQVMPNRVAGAPLSGTEPLVTLMDLAAVTTTLTHATDPARGVVRYSQGTHASVLDPTSPSLSVTQEMQTSAATFFASAGRTIAITNTTIVK